MLSLKLSILKQVAKSLGVDVDKLAPEVARQLVSKKMSLAAPGIARKMIAEGWTVGDQHTEAEVVRDALFRLWRKVFDFSGGGVLADFIRDAHDDKVIAATAEEIGVDTTPAEIVRLVLLATLELAF